MPNLQELLLRTRDLLRERGSTAHFEDYQLRRYLNDGQMDLVRRNPKAFPNLLTETTGTSSNGTADYSITSDDDFLVFHAAEIGGIPCKTITREQAWATEATVTSYGPTTLDPEVELIDDEQVRFYPTPGASTPAYSIWYWRRPHDLYQKIADFEYDETWTGSGVSTTDLNIGASEEEDTVNGLLLTASGSGTITGSYSPTTNLDLGDDTSDYIEVYCYTDETNVTDVRLYFETDGSNHCTETFLAANIDASGCYLRARKSEFTVTGTMDWTDIDKVEVLLTASDAATATFDDLRVYRTPEIDPAAHDLLVLYAVARALSSDEGWRAQNDPANCYLQYEAQVKALLGGG